MDNAKAPGDTKSGFRRPGRVRIVGRIRPFHEKEITTLATSSPSNYEAPPHGERCRPWISALKPNGESGDHDVVILGGQEEAVSGPRRVETYKLDRCYEQEEDTSEIFSREVKPLLDGVFHGCNACVIAYGARDSGKTQLIEGCDEKSGLAFLAMHEILAYGEKSQGEVMISCYEVNQDHVFDLLEPKEQGVQVLEDAGGKIQLKGLSQVPIKSIQDFKRLYYGCNQQTHLRKDMTNVISRRHKGLLIYVPCFHNKSNASLVGRMNIIDLAGYEDTKQKRAGPHLTESSRINKSLYALQNVVSALNADDGRVPYRENKLTHLLKDFINRESQTLIVTCLKPTPCIDTAQVLSISSRSCLTVNNSHSNSIKKKSGQIPIAWHSPSSDQQSIQLPSSCREKTFSISMRNPGVPRSGTTKNKAHVGQSPLVGRKLFNLRSPLIGSMEDKPFQNIFAGKESSEQEGQNSLQEISILASKAGELSIPEEDNTIITDVLETPSIQSKQTGIADALELPIQDSFQTDKQLNFKDADTITQIALCNISKDSTVTDKHYCLDIMNGHSPPISQRLREISNSLKILSCQPLRSCQPLSTKSPLKNDVSGNGQDGQGGTDTIEPRTPVSCSNFGTSGKWDAEKSRTPKETFKTQSAGLKNSLVQECLSFLNSASQEELKQLKGIGEKRLSYILELREEDPEPFKELNDLQQIGLTPKQAKGLVRNVISGWVL